jgi:hypothetical protein
LTHYIFCVLYSLFREEKEGEKKTDFDPEGMTEKIGKALERHGDRELIV